ncbi:MAG: PmeII family type II restriction endonuclease [Endomicrobiales bacterium]
MKTISIGDVTTYVEKNIGSFHRKRVENLEDLKLTKVLKRKNPYLFKAKNILTAQDLVKTLLDAHLSSQEEAIFGGFLEELAIYICGIVYGGRKSSAEGIDLEFEKDKTKYIVAIKSGPNWGNSGQIKNMKANFSKAKRILGTSSSAKMNITAVNGCCYGRDNKPNKGEYLKLCGQRFWEFISGNKDLYIQIIEPLGHKAKEKNEGFLRAYSEIINRFTHEFISDFCSTSGAINWNALVKFNSSADEPSGY